MRVKNIYDFEFFFQDIFDCRIKINTRKSHKNENGASKSVKKYVTQPVNRLSEELPSLFPQKPS